MSNAMSIEQATVPLESNGFLSQLLRHLSGALQDTVGLEEAEGFIAVVGQQIGDEINDSYREALQLPQLSEQQVAEVLVDLHKRIRGDFDVVEQTSEKIVLSNSRCPYGDKVVGREALCMMTSNIIGVIAAENLGYARVNVDESIARGHPGCVVTVYLQPPDTEESNPEHSGNGVIGHEFFSTA